MQRHQMNPHRVVLALWRCQVWRGAKSAWFEVQLLCRYCLTSPKLFVWVMFMSVMSVKTRIVTVRMHGV